jgi:hypothetical protein
VLQEISRTVGRLAELTADIVAASVHLGQVELELVELAVDLAKGLQKGAGALSLPPLDLSAQARPSSRRGIVELEVGERREGRDELGIRGG